MDFQDQDSNDKQEESRNDMSRGNVWNTDKAEQDSREENKLLWELYHGIYPTAKKANVDVDWASHDDFDLLIVGHWEVRQTTFTANRFKCLEIKPHTGEFNTDKFNVYVEDAEAAELFFEGHIWAREEEQIRVV